MYIPYVKLIAKINTKLNKFKFFNKRVIDINFDNTTGDNVSKYDFFIVYPKKLYSSKMNMMIRNIVKNADKNNYFRFTGSDNTIGIHDHYLFFTERSKAITKRALNG